MIQLRIVGLLALAQLAAPLGCSTRAREAPARPAASSVAPQQTRPVARIVFLDMQEACACTRKRVDDAWSLLSRTMATERLVPVERIHVDTEEGRAAPYRAQRAAQVMPAVYFLDDGNALVDMLQGELEEEPVARLLRGAR